MRLWIKQQIFLFVSFANLLDRDSMDLFSTYLQPIIGWLQQNPHWALLITFFISFSESLAIIGSIIPGSVTMTAIGILAGSGVMRIDLTLLAGTLGAIAGDSASYWMGYIFRHNLTHIWPFNRYPNWLTYGRMYFDTHGGKSVFIGRFFGPLRSIIPLVAGMMHMNRWHFLWANVISAILWSLLYILPGILIATASNELSPEYASRLFIAILIILAIIWLLSLLLKWLIRLMRQFFRPHLHHFWTLSKQHPRLAYYFNQLTPKKEINHAASVGLMVAFFFCGLALIYSEAMVHYSTNIRFLNQDIRLLLQSLHTPYFNYFFIIAHLIINPVAIISLFSGFLLYCFYVLEWRTARYWVSIIAMTMVINLLHYHLTRTYNLCHYIIETSHFSYPDFTLSISSTLLIFLILYLKRIRPYSLLNSFVRIILSISLALAGASALYLGINWFTSVFMAYLLGTFLALGAWIFYRVEPFKPSHKRFRVEWLFLFILLISGFISYHLYFKNLVNRYLTTPQYVITDNAWWNQEKTLLPRYVTNRLGEKISLFNIQYVGHLDALKEILLQAGWKKRSTLPFHTFLVSDKESSLATYHYPLYLYQHKKPALILSLKHQEKSTTYILRLWRSNYHIKNQKEPVWLGQLDSNTTVEEQNTVNFLQNFSHFIKPFKTKLLVFSIDKPTPDPSYILLIKQHL